MSTQRSSARADEAALKPDYVRFCDGIRSLTGIDLWQYRPAQMERRLRSHAERNGCHDLDAYLKVLRTDAAAMDSFLDRMTINVSELFRNPERFEELEKRIIPALLAAHPRGLKVWSAGCSYGAEVYSLAILMRELAPNQRHELFAFDIDERVLARAREGAFGATDMRNVTPARRQRWFTEEKVDGVIRWKASQELRSMITFKRFDLLKDPFPKGMHLVACRNVVIYFNDDAKDLLYRKFFDCLVPGGVLFVGATERINNADSMGWVKAGTFFYGHP